MKKAVITGASAGIGYYLAKELSKRGYILGLTARREHLLRKLASDLPEKSFVQVMDVSQPETAIEQLNDLIERMEGLDLIVLNAGIGNQNLLNQWNEERKTLDVNVIGFTALANAAYNYFAGQKSGHIIGISSVAAHFGYGGATAYNASKAFVSNYLSGLSHKAMINNTGILVTDLKPGFVDTQMTRHRPKFWSISPERAAFLIAEAIESHKRHAYIPIRWRYVAWLIRLLPDALLRKVL